MADLVVPFSKGIFTYVVLFYRHVIALHVAYTRGKRNRTLEETAFDLRPRSDAYFLEWESFEWKRRVKVDFRFPFLNTSIDFR